MTQAQWLASADPEAMLDFLDGHIGQGPLRLFATACCRRVGEQYTDDRARAALAACRRCGEENAGTKELAALLADASGWDVPILALRALRYAAAVPLGTYEARLAARFARHAHWTTQDVPDAPFSERLGAWRRLDAAEAASQAQLLRCLFDPVVLPPVVLDSSWRTPTVLAIAAQVSEEEDYRSLPILADALEEAGCTEPRVLNHLRGPELHARGCWALACVLGKQ